MAFNIKDYYQTRETDGGDNPAPDDIRNGLIEAVIDITLKYPRLKGCDEETISSRAKTVGRIVAAAVAFERPQSFYNIKLTATQEEITTYFLPVLTRVPNIAAIYENYVTTDGGKLTQETDETHTTNAGETSTTATNKEKFNPVEAPFSRLSNESTNETNGTATSGGTSTVTRSKNAAEQLKEYAAVKDPLRPIVRAICGALVYTAEELEEVYYLDNEE